MRSPGHVHEREKRRGRLRTRHLPDKGVDRLEDFGCYFGSEAVWLGGKNDGTDSFGLVAGARNTDKRQKRSQVQLRIMGMIEIGQS